MIDIFLQSKEDGLVVVCDPREAQKGCRRALGLLTQLHTGATGDSRGAEGFGGVSQQEKKGRSLAERAKSARESAVWMSTMHDGWGRGRARGRRASTTDFVRSNEQ